MNKVLMLLIRMSEFNELMGKGNRVVATFVVFVQCLAQEPELLGATVIQIKKTLL